MGLCLGKSKSSGKADKSTVKSMNNKVLLEKLIASSNGNYNPIRDFSFQELTTATNNYDRERIIIQESGYILYKGVLNARAVSILKFGENYNSDNQYKFCFNNIVFGSQMSHKNILKLIGCCLETQIPILVFESIELGTLADRIYRRRRHNFEPLPFRNRLKVAMELANAVAYLHAGFARPIIFMSATPWRIFFDEQNVAKLSDFSLSVSIPEGETHVDVQIAGTRGYIAPEVLLEAKCNEKYDVHSFGMLLLDLLTGQKITSFCRDKRLGVENYLWDLLKKYVEENGLNEMVDPMMIEEGLCPRKEQLLQAYLDFAFKCVSESPEERPTMIDVAKQLRQMYLSC
ncbi:protein kinase domain-containing protein [Citrus sinensis]|uniref:Protein kinase domain-containing protein n=1 Tax=Citrus sinensis TaxID=2711 RepID=A0ACB8KL03_CITSI|nr:protein kinase domain-containing protein [Citrus sinensis]